MRIIGSEVIYACKKFALTVHDLEKADGERLRREYIAHPGSVVLLPILPDSRVVLVRNYRHTVDQVLLELPAGTRDPGEPFERTAARELAEETGYTAGRLTKLLEFYPSPGIIDERMALFLAEDLVEGSAATELDEELFVEVVPISEAIAMTRDGRIQDAKTFVGLWYWAAIRV